MNAHVTAVHAIAIRTSGAATSATDTGSIIGSTRTIDAGSTARRSERTINTGPGCTAAAEAARTVATRGATSCCWRGRLRRRRRERCRTCHRRARGRRRRARRCRRGRHRRKSPYDGAHERINSALNGRSVIDRSAAALGLSLLEGPGEGGRRIGQAVLVDRLAPQHRVGVAVELSLRRHCRSPHLRRSAFLPGRADRRGRTGNGHTDERRRSGEHSTNALLVPTTHWGLLIRLRIHPPVIPIAADVADYPTAVCCQCKFRRWIHRSATHRQRPHRVGRAPTSPPFDTCAFCPLAFGLAP